MGMKTSLLTLFLITSAIVIMAFPANAQEAPDCESGETTLCGSNIGQCSQGYRDCVDGQWGDCIGETEAKPEICNNGLDDDCDGLTDECGSFMWMVMLGVGMLLFAMGIAVANKWTD